MPSIHCICTSPNSLLLNSHLTQLSLQTLGGTPNKDESMILMSKERTLIVIQGTYLAIIKHVQHDINVSNFTYISNSISLTEITHVRKVKYMRTFQKPSVLFQIIFCIIRYLNPSFERQKCIVFYIYSGLSNTHTLFNIQRIVNCLTTFGSCEITWERWATMQTFDWLTVMSYMCQYFPL